MQLLRKRVLSQRSRPWSNLQQNSNLQQSEPCKLWASMVITFLFGALCVTLGVCIILLHLPGDVRAVSAGIALVTGSILGIVLCMLLLIAWAQDDEWASEAQYRRRSGPGYGAILASSYL